MMSSSLALVAVNNAAETEEGPHELNLLEPINFRFGQLSEATRA